jgi:L-threonylcarbamoyladenylate synthase
MQHARINASLPPTRAPVQASPAAIEEAAALLRAGKLVAFPTETVYGLGADATSGAAVAGIFAAKDRPRLNPLIVHVADLGAAQALAGFSETARALAAAFWPGPLTLVLPRSAACEASPLVSAGLPTIAVRVPGHPVAQDLLGHTGRPLAAPSANASGRLSPTTGAHVASSLGARVAMILDSGACPSGLESAIVGLAGTRPVLLRPGAIAREELEAVAGPLGTAAAGGPVSAPGMLRRHYAPRTPLRLEVIDARPGEALIAFGPDVADGFACVRNLSPAGDLKEAAANLFRILHELDGGEWTAIAVAPIPEDGLGAAINDRLRRAAAKDGTE